MRPSILSKAPSPSPPPPSLLLPVLSVSGLNLLPHASSTHGPLPYSLSHRPGIDPEMVSFGGVSVNLEVGEPGSLPLSLIINMPVSVVAGSTHVLRPPV